MEDIFTLQNLIALLSGGLGLLIGATFVGAKLKSVILQVQEAVNSYKNAISETSAGGTTVTPEEKAAIADESVDVIEELVTQYGDTLIGKLLGIKNDK